MYERIKEDLTQNAGSTSLPAVLNINTSIYKSTILKNSTIISNGVVQSKNSLLGSIGNNYCEFSINVDYYNSSIDYSSSVKSILTQLNNDEYITISTSTLKSMFYIYEIPDYSAQSMSMRNYDYFVKVFLKDGSKVSSKAIMIIKSFTMKKAWVLIDKIVFYNTDKTVADIDYLFIDFIYNITNYEKLAKQLKYSQNNNYANLQGLFNTTSTASPYFDQFYYKDDTDTLNVINKQAEYFNYTILDNFDISKRPDNEAMNLDNLYSLIARDDTISFDYDKFRVFYTTDATKYTKSLAYEVYYYSDNSYLGKRCLLNTVEHANYEIYPILPDMIHYIYEYDYKDGKSTFDLVDIHNELFRLKQYLYDYNFQQYNTFNENNKKYVEVYIPYHYEGLNKYQETVTNGSENITLTEISAESNDYRSVYDPTRTWQNSYESAEDQEKYIIPYFGNDSYITDILGDNARIYSDVLNINDLKTGKVYDKYFDILAANTLSTNNIVTDKYVDNFKKVRISSDEIRNKFIDIDKQNNELCKNLSYLLPDDISFTTGKLFTLGSCFYVYIRSANASLNLTFSYTVNEQNIKLNREYYPYNKNNNNEYEYIIPNENDLSAVECSENINYYIVY